MNSIAIITARGGSKRIPRKNIKEFCGKPIIEYSIKAALESNIFDEVMVSTDDKEIADISIKAGACVPFFRSPDTSDDYSTTADVLMEVFQEYKKIGKTFKYAACIYPTAPFVTAEKLRNSFDTFKENDGIMLMPVIKFGFPPQRSMVMKDEKIEYKWPQYRTSRSQDLEEMYHDCGQYYFYRVDDYIKKQGQISEKIIPLIVSEMEAQDIDTEEDWRIAEFKYMLMMQSKK
ncbi:pseudaminic acid cytidylyltransferase [uncultured Clostridium sp.]|uniref:pseudaminic acid cytidylyltransferase n=1 Tax=uncultured Clostridium sp. TaxID=59620 RepID=UPI0025F015DB|nr:pseudaminic acid cytidylyltransferase [uncultured Clostridium sp.]